MAVPDRDVATANYGGPMVSSLSNDPDGQIGQFFAESVESEKAAGEAGLTQCLWNRTGNPT
jgi:hypothetical protein